MENNKCIIKSIIYIIVLLIICFGFYSAFIDGFNLNQEDYDEGFGNYIKIQLDKYFMDSYNLILLDNDSRGNTVSFLFRVDVNNKIYYVPVAFKESILFKRYKLTDFSIRTYSHSLSKSFFWAKGYIVTYEYDVKNMNLDYEKSFINRELIRSVVFFIVIFVLIRIFSKRIKIK